MLFQTFSRDNSKNGLPYRLNLVYDANGQVIEGYESRVSVPYMTNILAKKYMRLPSAHLSIKGYNELKNITADVTRSAD
jgi:hypothetical protein